MPNKKHTCDKLDMHNLENEELVVEKDKYGWDLYGTFGANSPLIQYIFFCPFCGVEL